MSHKRKRETHDDYHPASKKIHQRLFRKCYRPTRTVQDVLNCDVNELTGGHFVGKLLSIEKTGDRTDIYLEDDTGSVVLCELHLYFDHLPLNESLSTHVHVAVAEPERAKITNAKKYPNFLYKYKLVFKLGCSLILNGRRFNGGKERDVMSESSSSSDDDSEMILDNSQTADTLPTSSPTLQQPSKRRHTASDTSEAPQRKHSSSQMAVNSRVDRPGGWTSIGEVLSLESGRITVGAIVEHSGDVRQFPRGDWGLELRLLDEGSNDRRIGVKLYATRQSHLPEVQEGQAIILSNLLVKRNSRGFIELTGYKDGTHRYLYHCYDGHRAQPFVSDASNGAPIYSYRPDELAYLQWLTRWHSGDVSVPTEQQPKPDGRLTAQHKLVKDVNVGDYFSCTVELLQMIRGNHLEILVTDYTANDALLDRQKGNKKIPPGRQTLQITLFDHPAAQASQLVVGSIYRLNNVRMYRKGDFTQARCGNFRQGEKNEILILDAKDPTVQELKRRKKGLDSKGSAFANFVKHDESDPMQYEPYPEASETLQMGSPRKSASREGFIAIAQPRRQREHTQDHDNPNQPTSRMKRETLSSPPINSLPQARPRPDLTTTLKSENPVYPLLQVQSYPPFPEGPVDISELLTTKEGILYPLVSTEQMLEWNTVPARLRLEARIVDISPRNLNDAVDLYCAGCKLGNGAEGKCSECQNPTRLRVKLMLVLQDATGLLVLHIWDDRAVKFFRLQKVSKGSKEKLLDTLATRLGFLMGNEDATTAAVATGKKGKGEKEGKVAKARLVGGLSGIFGITVRIDHYRLNPGDVPPIWQLYYSPSECSVDIR